ncbi:MAG TPA: MFS transporter [Burkholderiales bacterium]|nr:MFS transporter [Burkholderiales bacterium]
MTGFLLPLIVTLAVQIQASLVVFTPPVLAPVAEIDVGVRASAVGIVTALIYGASIPAALLAGHVLERVGAIRVSQFCLLLTSAGMALIAVPSAWVIALGALVAGLGYGTVTPASSTVLAERVPPGWRVFLFSLKQTGVPVGGAIAGALVPVAIDLFGWQAAALGVALLGLVVAAAAQTVQRAVDSEIPPRRSAHGTGLVEPLRLVFSHARLRELALSSFAYSGMQMCLGSYLVVSLMERTGFSVTAAGAALSAAMIAGAIGRLFWGAIADNWVSSRRLLGLLGLAMSGAAFLTAAIGAAWPPPAIYALAFFFGASAVGWNGVYLAEVARIAPPGRAGAATGASLAMTYSGVMVLPSLFWLIHAATDSYAAAFVSVGALTLWRGAAFLRGR